MTIAPAVSPTASSQLIQSTLRAAAGVTGMRLLFSSAIDEQTYTWRQLHGAFDGIQAGLSLPLSDTFCARMLKGAAPSTADASVDPSYADVPMREALGIRSYVGVPLRTRGIVTGELGGISADSVVVSPADLRVLASLARIMNAEATRDPEVRLHRTATGWEVEQSSGAGTPADDVTLAMSLADLIAGDSGETVHSPRPQRPAETLSDVERLRMQITQLEHALTARVVIEQAIGVVSQRFGLAPREAFDRMRKTARSRGQRVHDLAVSLVRSARDPSVSLPPDLQATS